MSFFDQVYRKLFPTPQVEKMLLFEPIKRSNQFLEDYKNWTNSYKGADFLQKIYAAYLLQQQGMTSIPDMHLLQTARSNGFAIVYDQHSNKTEFQFLFDWLAEKVKALGYKKSNSDVTIHQRSDYIETIEKHYLKPKISTQPKKQIEQRFGNILIELISRDDVPVHLRVIVNNYSDRMYTKAHDFDFLAEYLLSKA